ncbi:MAG TPA: hypothetical protein VH206_14390 [Xanthobacteraceae bacterium]|nr:hypothetical protein [Xanthobacteraceae bacterium]
MLRTIGALLFVIAATSGVSAQTLQCETGTTNGSGVYNGAQEVVVDRSNSNPKLDASDTIVAGGCDFQTWLGTPGSPHPEEPSVLFWQKSIANGYSCKAGARTANAFVLTTAKIVGCHIVPDLTPAGPSAPFSNLGLGGSTVAVARTTKGPVPYGIRACNLLGGADIAFDIGLSQDVVVKMGSCLEVDQPARVFFRTPDTVTVDEFGSYALFAPGILSQTPRSGLPTNGVEDKRIKVGDFHSAVSSCAPPAPGVPFDTADYWGYCPMSALQAGKNYRVCVDAGYSAQGAKLEYPGSLLPIIVDPARMSQPPGGPDEYQYMLITANTCRDLFGITTVSLLILGKNNWNDQSVRQFLYRYAEIP